MSGAMRRDRLTPQQAEKYGLVGVLEFRELAVRRDEMEREIQANLEAWNRHDAAGTVAMCADDCVLQMNSQRVQGRDVMQSIAQGYFDAFPDFRLEFTSMWIDGNTVLEEWRSSGTNAQTGQQTVVMGFGLDQFGEDGKVHRSAVYFDTAALAAGGDTEQASVEQA
jgi:ketosteroid isomerase-like protein